jgi:hypothetical protein
MKAGVLPPFSKRNPLEPFHRTIENMLLLYRDDCFFNEVDRLSQVVVFDSTNSLNLINVDLQTGTSCCLESGGLSDQSRSCLKTYS